MKIEEKIAKMQAIKEEFAATQSRLLNAKKLEEAAQSTHLAKLLENDLAQAEIILAAKDIMTKLQDMAEDLAKLHAQELFPLVDEMKTAFGPQPAETFEALAQTALQDALNMVRKAKESINTGILQVEGKLPMNDMAIGNPAEPVMPEIGMDAEAGAPEDTMLGDLSDEFGGAEAAAGAEGDPMGRLKKESIEEGKTHKYDDEEGSKSAKKKDDKAIRDEKKNKRKVEESMLFETAGNVLLEKVSLDALVKWYLKEAASAMPASDYDDFAQKVHAKAKQSPAKMAGYIGAKKYGHAAMAQLAAPAMTACESVEEGRTFKYDDEDGGRQAKGKEDRAWRQKRKARRDVDAHNSDDDDKMNESERKAMAIAKIIESNVLAFGKGKAAQVVKQFSETALVEGESQSILEAFQDMYGMRPAQYSVSIARELSEAGLALSDQKKVDHAMTSIASKMAGDKSVAKKPVSAIISQLDPADRAAVQKQTNAMRKDGGQPPKTVGDLVTGAAGDDDDKLAENINAAHWAVDTMGQYKGEVVEPDLEPLKTPKAETKSQPEGGAEAKTAPEPKPEAKEPKATEEPKEEAAEEPKEEKAEEPKEKTGNPFAKQA